MDKNNKIITKDNKVIDCDNCPCDTGYAILSVNYAGGRYKKTEYDGTQLECSRDCRLYVKKMDQNPLIIQIYEYNIQVQLTTPCPQQQGYIGSFDTMVEDDGEYARYYQGQVYALTPCIPNYNTLAQILYTPCGRTTPYPPIFIDDAEHIASDAANDCLWGWWKTYHQQNYMVTYFLYYPRYGCILDVGLQRRKWQYDGDYVPIGGNVAKNDDYDNEYFVRTGQVEKYGYTTCCENKDTHSALPSLNAKLAQWISDEDCYQFWNGNQLNCWRSESLCTDGRLWYDAVMHGNSDAQLNYESYVYKYRFDRWEDEQGGTPQDAVGIVFLLRIKHELINTGYGHDDEVIYSETTEQEKQHSLGRCIVCPFPLK